LPKQDGLAGLQAEFKSKQASRADLPSFGDPDTTPKTKTIHIGHWISARAREGRDHRRGHSRVDYRRSVPRDLTRRRPCVAYANRV